MVIPVPDICVRKNVKGGGYFQALHLNLFYGKIAYGYSFFWVHFYGGMHNDGFFGILFKLFEENIFILKKEP